MSSTTTGSTPQSESAPGSVSEGKICPNLDVKLVLRKYRKGHPPQYKDPYKVPEKVMDRWVEEENEKIEKCKYLRFDLEEMVADETDLEAEQKSASGTTMSEEELEAYRESIREDLNKCSFWQEDSTIEGYEFCKTFVGETFYGCDVCGAHFCDGCWTHNIEHGGHPEFTGQFATKELLRAALAAQIPGYENQIKISDLKVRAEQDWAQQEKEDSEKEERDAARALVELAKNAEEQRAIEADQERQLLQLLKDSLSDQHKGSPVYDSEKKKRQREKALSRSPSGSPSDEQKKKRRQQAARRSRSRSVSPIKGSDPQTDTTLGTTERADRKLSPPESLPGHHA